MRIAFYDDIDDGIQVWLEHDVQFSGLCIGFGATRAAAAECAAEFLRKKIDAVFTAAEFAGSGAPRTVNGEARAPHSSAASSADPLPSQKETAHHCLQCGRLILHSGICERCADTYPSPLPSERDPLECAEIQNPVLRASLQEVGRILLERDEAYGYLSRLFVHLAPQCRPLPDLPGLCTQIDNYIAGLHAKLAAADSALRTLRLQWLAKADRWKKVVAAPETKPYADGNARALTECAADLDRLCPEIREKKEPT